MCWRFCGVRDSSGVPAAERRTDEQMEEISTACREMGEATTLSSRTQADTRFHLAILRASGNDLLVPLGALIESALKHLFVFVTRELNDARSAHALHELLANTDEVIVGSRR